MTRTATSDEPQAAGDDAEPSAPVVTGQIRAGQALKVGRLTVAVDDLTITFSLGPHPIARLSRDGADYRFIAYALGPAWPELVDGDEAKLPLVSIGQGTSRRDIHEEDLKA